MRRCCAKSNSNRGVTLVELLVTLVIAAILLTLAAPSFNEFIQRSNTSTAVDKFVESINLARSEAIKRGLQVVIRKTGSHWEDGWTIFSDNNRNGQLSTTDGDELLYSQSKLEHGFTLRTDSTTSTWFAYLPSGFIKGDISNNTKFFLCRNDKDKPKSRTIKVNNAGNVYVSEGVTTCP